MPNLSYRDRWLREVDQANEQADCVGSPVSISPTDDNYITLKLTEHQITQLHSAIAVGARLAYPENYHDIEWLFVAGLECNMLCDAVADCISNNPETLQTIINVLADAGVLQQTAGSDVISDEAQQLVLYDLGEGCDDDDRYGVCYKVVELLDVVSTDMFDALAVYSNNVDIAIALAQKIPIIGQYTATPLQVAKYMVDIAIDSYAASYGTDTHDDIACRIFCKMDGACQLTLSHVLDAYRDVLTIELDPPPIGATDWLTVAEWYYSLLAIVEDEVLVASVHWLILQVFARGSAFFASTSRIMQIALSGSVPIPPAEDCDCATTWGHTWIFDEETGSAPNTTYGDGGWVTRGASEWGATYTAGVGWVSSGSGGQVSLGIRLALGDCNLSHATVWFSDGSIANAYIGFEKTDFNFEHYQSIGAGESGVEKTFNFNHDVGVAPYLAAGVGSGTASGHKITKIEAGGNGSKPTIA